VPVVLAGWSFGAAVAVRLAERDDSLAACVAIAPAVLPREDVTAGLPSATEAEIDVPLLLVCAVNDEVASCPDCEAWASEAHADHRTIPGANHFFWGKYEHLAAELEKWLDDVL
jgi:alpha/beta superfamily hydrolase